jgi:hypothetical protein
MAHSAWQRIMASLHSLSALAHANLWPPEVCVLESNRVQASRRGRSIRDWL